MTSTLSDPTWVAFEHHRRTARGTPGDVIAALGQRLAEHPDAMPVVLDATTSERIELNWRLPPDGLLALVPAPPPATAGDEAPEEPARGPGRPKLGVTAREVTLLPRHWDWLARQPGGASVALRKLVQSALREGSAADTKRRATDAAYRFMATVAGDLPAYEEVSRALFAGELERLRSLVSGWPADVSEQLLSLTARIDAVTPGN
jgi:uncharacterized protein